MDILKDDKQITDEIVAVASALLKDREVECAKRENRLLEVTSDIENLLDLLTVLGHGGIADRMRARFKRNHIL